MTQRDSLEASEPNLESRIRNMQYNMRASEIIAPFNGYVTIHHTEIGQWIGVGDKILELVDIDTVEIMVPLPERYLGDVKQGEVDWENWTGA